MTQGASPDIFAELRSSIRSIGQRDAIIALVLVSAWFALSFARLEFTRNAITVNNCIFGADAATYAKALASGQYTGLKSHKHALAVVVVGLLAGPLSWAGIAPAVAGSVALAVVDALAVLLVFVFARRAGLATLHAAAFAVLALASLGTISLLGIAETYGVTLAMIAAACVAFPIIASGAWSRPVAAGLFASLFVAGLALANAPAIAFVLVYLSCLRLQGEERRDLRRTWPAIVIPVLVGLVAVALPALVEDGAAGAAWHVQYLSRYARLSNFADPGTLLNFAASAFVFAFVAPFEYLQCRFVAADIGAMIASPLRVVTFLALAPLLILGTARALRSANRPVTGGLLASAAAILLFYLFFNPDEALLYSPQWTLALFLAAASGVARSLPWIAGAAALCLIVNLPPLSAPRTLDPQRCCPNPPATMLPREMPRILARQLARAADPT